MDKEQLTWFDVKASASYMFNIMGHNKGIGFAENVWQKFTDSSLNSYSNNFELIKLKLLFLSFGDLYKDFCKVVYNKHTVFMHTDLLKLMSIDEFTLGRFYQEIIKPKEKKIPANFNSSKALEELSKYFRKDIFKLLVNVCGSSNALFISLWRSTYPYSDEDNLKDFELLFNNLTPAKSKAYSWIENGCYVILDSEAAF